MSNLTKKSRIGFIENKIILALISIVISGLLFRIYFGNFEIPLTADSLNYFLYAMDISTNSQLPNYLVGNNGWPIFVSGFFSIFEFESVLAYMQVQKILTVILSSLTIIPVYFLCRKFFNNKLSLIGAIMFAFEPRIILNSSLGITESLYIVLGTISLVFFLDSNKKIVYSSFVIISFISMIRSEGIFLFVAISIMFIIRFRKDKLVIPKYIFVLAIFILILLPMTSYRTEVNGHDGLSQRVINGFNAHILGSDEFPEEHLEEIGNNTQKSFLINGSQNFIKYLGWDLIPIFILFIPIGAYFLFKNLDVKKGTVILCIILLSIPIFYAYSIPLEDTRYFFFLYPMFVIISLFTIEKIDRLSKNQNKILVLIGVGIIFSSTVFLNFKSIDYEHEMDAFKISQVLINKKITINEYLPESQYLEASKVLIDKSVLESYFSKEKEKGVSVMNIIEQNVKVKNVGENSSLRQFIQNNNDLTHIVADDRDNRSSFLKDAFKNELDYPYLIKEFDSKEKGFDYHLKLFKIDYSKLN